MEAPSKGASDVVTVEYPAVLADLEVTVGATSGEVAVAVVSNDVTVGAAEVGEEALIGDELAVEAIFGKSDATGATLDEVASVGEWAD